MLYFAFKNLLAEKSRLLIGISGIGLAITLIVVLLAIYFGSASQSSAYIDESGADIWVTGEGVTDMFHTFSILPQEAELEINNVAGVETISPLVARVFTINRNNKESSIYLIGYDPDLSLGQPPVIKEGDKAPSQGKIIVDKVFAQQQGLIIGDNIDLRGRIFQIAGISEKTNIFFFQYIFMTLTEAAELLDQADLKNFLLINVNDGVPIEEVRDNLSEEVQGVEVYKTETFSENNAAITKDSFLPIIFIITLIGFVVALVVIGLTIYSATVERESEYGVLKAIGASTTQLSQSIFLQAFLLTFLGLLLGLILSILAIWLVQLTTPIVPFEHRPITYGLVVFLSLVVAPVSAYIPLNRIARIDPTDVFKA